MKKVLTLLTAALAAVTLAACTPSDISSAESTAVPEGVTAAPEESKMSIKDKPTVEYSIPADAPTGVDGGPGVMETTAVDDSYYPEDKRSSAAASEDAAEESVYALYTVDDTGIYQTMADVSGADAKSMIAAMVDNAILAEGTEVVAFTEDGTTAVLELNQLKPVYEKASEEEILACVVNTLTENLGLESIDVKAGDKDYGTQTFTDAFDRT